MTVLSMFGTINLLFTVLAFSSLSRIPERKDLKEEVLRCSNVLCVVVTEHSDPKQLGVDRVYLAYTSRL